MLVRNAEHAKVDTAVHHGRILIEALENFINPIIQAHSGEDLRPCSVNDGQGLLSALAEFIAALVHPKLNGYSESNAEKEKAEKESISTAPDVQLSNAQTIDKVYNICTEVVEANSSSGTTQFWSTEDRPQLLRLALGKGHRFVFNQMPIRLLTFNPDGSEIRLLERNDLWRLISTNMENNYNENKIESEIRRIQHSRNISREAAEEIVLSRYVAIHTNYAALSHTWLQGAQAEVTYTDWIHQKIDRDSAGYQKLTNFCRVAAKEYGCTIGWMDTICIDKQSSSELDESIRSMFSWYQSSAVCITYLANTTSLHHMSDDVWFTRGWTLQELLAPRFIKFYSKDWLRIIHKMQDDKQNPDVVQQIFQATTITMKELRRSLWKTRISRRMEWAAKRQVTREEDTAYSLMGIFDVSISTAYGEGAERAFVRLFKEILNTDSVNLLDIVNWGYGHKYPSNRPLSVRTSNMIPACPAQYVSRAQTYTPWYRPTTPVILTQLGLRLSVLLMPGMISDPKKHFRAAPLGNYYSDQPALETGN